MANGLDTELHINIVADDDTAPGFNRTRSRVERLQRTLRNLNSDSAKAANMAAEAGATEIQRLQQSSRVRLDELKKQTVTETTLSKDRQTEHRSQLSRIQTEGRSELQRLQRLGTEEEGLQRTRTRRHQNERRRVERFQTRARRHRRDEIDHEQALRREIQRTNQIRTAAFGGLGAQLARRDFLGIAGSFTDATIAAGGFGLAIAAVGASIVRHASDYEQLTRSLQAITGSSEAAASQLRDIQELAELPGITFRDASRSTVRLRSAGFDQQVTNRLIREFGNAAAASGAAAADSAEAIRQFTQIASTERITAENLNVILERLPVLRPVLVEEFGTAVGGQLQKTLEAQNISFNEFTNKLLTGLEAIPRVAPDTFSNAASNLQNALDELQRELGKSILPALTKLVEILTSIINFWNRTVGGTPVGDLLLFGGLGTLFGKAGFSIFNRVTGRTRRRQLIDDLASVGLEIGAEGLIDVGIDRTTTRTTTRTTRRTARTSRRSVTGTTRRIAGEAGEEFAETATRRGVLKGLLSSWDEILTGGGLATSAGSFLYGRSAIARHAANFPDLKVLSRNFAAAGRPTGLQFGQIVRMFDKLGMIRFSQFASALGQGLNVFHPGQISTAVKIGTLGGRYPLLGAIPRLATAGVIAGGVGLGAGTIAGGSYIGRKYDPFGAIIPGLERTTTGQTKEIEEEIKEITEAQQKMNAALGGTEAIEARETFLANIKIWRDNLLTLGIPITALAKQFRDFYDSVYGKDAYPELSGKALRDKLQEDAQTWSDSIRQEAVTGLQQIENLEKSMQEWADVAENAEKQAVSALTEANKEFASLNAQIANLTLPSGEDREYEVQVLQNKLRISLATIDAHRKELQLISELEVPQHQEAAREKERLRIFNALQAAVKEYLSLYEQVERLALPLEVRIEIQELEQRLPRVLARINEIRKELERIRSIEDSPARGRREDRTINKLRRAVKEYQKIVMQIEELEGTEFDISKEKQQQIEALEKQREIVGKQVQDAQDALTLAQKQTSAVEQRVKTEKEGLESFRLYLNMWKEFGSIDLSGGTFRENFPLTPDEVNRYVQSQRGEATPFVEGAAPRPPVPRTREPIVPPRFEEIAPGSGRPTQPFPAPPPATREGVFRNVPLQDYLRNERNRQLRLGILSGRFNRPDLSAPADLFVPDFADDLRKQYNAISKSFTDMITDVKGFRRQGGLAAIFSPQLIGETQAVLEGIEDTRNSALGLFNAMRDNAPLQLADEMFSLHRVIVDLNKEIDSLKSNISLSQSFLQARLILNDITGEFNKLRASTEGSRQSFGKFLNYFAQISGRIPETRRKINEERQRAAEQRRNELASSFERTGQSFYQQFGADFLLEAVGIGGRSQDRVRDALADLKMSFDETTEEIASDSLLSESERLEEMKQLHEQYIRDRRSIEERAEEERARAWRDWTKNVLVDFGRVIYEQLRLNLALKAANFILTSLPLGSGGSASPTQQYTSPIGPGNAASLISAAGSGSGAGAAIGTAGTVAVGVAAAATAINGLIDPVKDILNSFSFHDAANDQYAMQEAAKAARKITGGQTPSQYGRQSAKDLVDNIVGGLSSGMQPAGSQGQGGNITHITVPVTTVQRIGTREIQEINEVGVTLDESNRLVSPGNSRVQREVDSANIRAVVQSATNPIRQQAQTAQNTATSAMTQANDALDQVRALRRDVEGKIVLG